MATWISLGTSTAASEIAAGRANAFATRQSARLVLFVLFVVVILLSARKTCRALSKQDDYRSRISRSLEVLPYLTLIRNAPEHRHRDITQRAVDLDQQSSRFEIVSALSKT
jgi:hypothetical protein